MQLCCLYFFFFLVKFDSQIEAWKQTCTLVLSIVATLHSLFCFSFFLSFFFSFFFSSSSKGCVSVHFWKYHQPARCPMNPGTVIPARPADSECELTFEFDRFPTPILAAPLTPYEILLSRGTVQEEGDRLPNLAHTNMTGELETPTEALLGNIFFVVVCLC